jgi:uncharacterized protein
MLYALSCRYSQRAFLYAVPIGGLAGLVGLGGGEFRLPVLTQVIGFSPRAAIPLNLLISLAALSFALATRSHAVPVSGVIAHWPEVTGLTLGGTVSAIFGARVVLALSERRLTMVTATLIAALGLVLLVEAVIPFGNALLAIDALFIRALAGLLVGLGVGAVSSMLGVAGGELLIPALMFLFGADIRVAGSASLLISLAIVATGVWRYRQAGALPITGGPRRIAISMSAGSLIGAVLGGMAVAVAPAILLKVVLGAVLIFTAIKTVARTVG